MKRLSSICAAMALAVVSYGQAAASPVTDCPMRDAPYSISSPLVDIMLNPAAKAAVESQAPDVLRALPPALLSTTAPTFAAILSLSELGRMAGMESAILDKADKALREIAVTQADRIARCARYDDERPSFRLPRGALHILLFEKITGFRDGPSVDAARTAFQTMANKRGWALVVTDKGGAMTPRILQQFDLVIWNNVSGDVLTLAQRRAFKSYIERGGGFLGVHGSAGDPATFWDWYIDTLIGARFAGHPMNPQFQDAKIVIEHANQTIAAGLPKSWTMTDEWYSFRNNPRTGGAAVVAALDESSYSPQGAGTENLRMGDHPIAWLRCVGKGRAFYSAIGHRPEAYADGYYLQMLENAVGWTSTRGARCAKQTLPPG